MGWLLTGINRILGWLALAASERSGAPSSKRLGFLFTIGVTGGAIAGLVAALVWVATMNCTGPQAVEAARIIADALVWIVGTALTAATGGYVGGKAVEGKAGDTNG